MITQVFYQFNYFGSICWNKPDIQPLNVCFDGCVCKCAGSDTYIEFFYLISFNVQLTRKGLQDNV